MKRSRSAQLNFAAQQALIERMKLAATDKQRIMSYIKGDAILELGCAGGNIISMIINAFPHAQVTGIDYNPDLVKIAKHSNPQALFLVRDVTDWKDIELFFGKYSAVVMSSFLHEVGAYYGVGKVGQIIEETVKLLEVDGRIIVRDGVKPEHQTVTFQLKNPDIEVRLMEFQKKFTPSAVKLVRTADPLTYSMDSWDFHDFLCKYYFEEALWKEDLEERFGYHTQDNYMSLLPKSVVLLHVESYVAPYLLNRWHNDFTLLNGNFPSSHILLVGSKRR